MKPRRKSGEEYKESPRATVNGQRMMDVAREYGLIQDEIFSEKGRTAEDAILQQVLMYDIAHQLRRPLLVAT